VISSLLSSSSIGFAAFLPPPVMTLRDNESEFKVLWGIGDEKNGKILNAASLILFCKTVWNLVFEKRGEEILIITTRL